MNEYVFLARVKSEYGERCIYIEKKHHRDIVGNIIFQGASWCGFEKENRELIENDKFESYLTKEEIIDLLDNENSYDKYIEKLTSEQGVAFKNKIMEDEHEYLKDEYGLDDADIKRILDNYDLDYEDREIVCSIFDNTEELAYDYVKNCCEVEEWIENFIDYERLGETLADNYDYIQLKDERVVRFSY